MENIISQLPGFRFHPTEEELVNYYLKETVLGKNLYCEIIGFLNIYNHYPWDLPGMAKIGEREWYFFVQRETRSGHGGKKPNRTTERGYWKATGSDRQIRRLTEPKIIMGLRKTLVFYTGKAPNGNRTDWVMNEAEEHALSSYVAQNNNITVPLPLQHHDYGTNMAEANSDEHGPSSYSAWTTMTECFTHCGP
ncbi:hypothetical protein Gotur_003975 [Gossypium turneri]